MGGCWQRSDPGSRAREEAARASERSRRLDGEARADYRLIKMATPRKARGTWGGRRPGAGRKPGPNPKVPHRALGRHLAKEPVLMTLHSRLDSLKSPRVFAAIRRAVAGTNGQSPEEFRIVHFSVAPSHVHLVVEARDARSLSSGARSITIRIARYVNDALARTGSLWADRWRRRTLKNPEDLREALVQVGKGIASSVPPRSALLATAGRKRQNR
jgi:REP element-mobilizing transposase RayT